MLSGAKTHFKGFRREEKIPYFSGSKPRLTISTLTSPDEPDSLKGLRKRVSDKPIRIYSVFNGNCQ
ncbi:hypothetical protein CKG00_04875 [Morganella morganii]|uniref:Uncharacterized protein n=1 Tax=Morganella morganii TaxID=582 RepID=A0A433ZUJ2_MORMO|nr:hypothetical protein CKG00_04875 [Morganella morganii]